VKVTGNGTRIFSGSNMNKKDYLETLQRQHDDLDKIIDEEYRQFKDDSLVKHMKKKKLQLKDEIEVLSKQLNG